MTTSAGSDRPLEDPVSNVLKWVLLAVAVGKFGALRLGDRPDLRAGSPATRPGSSRPVKRTPTTADDIVAGKAGFQKADLMDYGSLYGMGSYFGQDYTAFALVRLAKLTEEQLAQTRVGSWFRHPAHTIARPGCVRRCSGNCKGSTSTQREVAVPEALANAIATLRAEMAKNLRTRRSHHRLDPGLQPRRDRGGARGRVLDLLGPTTVARRPDTTWSWTENWPYEPKSGTPRRPTLSFGPGPASASPPCFRRRAVYLRALFSNPIRTRRPMDPVLVTVSAADQQSAQDRQILSSSWRRCCCCCRSWPARSWRMPITIAAASTVSISTISCHSISSATCTFKPRSSGSASAWIGSGLFLAPAIAGGREARGQGLLVDLLFYVTLIIVAGALIGDWLGIMGHMGQQSWFWSRQSGPLLHPARPVLADRLLRRTVDLERPDVPRPMADRRDAAPGDTAVLVGAHSPGKPDLGRDPQHRDRATHHELFGQIHRCASRRSPRPGPRPSPLCVE